MISSDDPRRRAWRLFVETHAALFGQLAEELQAEVGLSMPWYDVLLHLAEAEGGRLRMRALADAVVISKSGLTTLVDRMEAAGLVRRELAADDRRAVEVTLTEAGRRRFKEAAAVHGRGIDARFCAHLSREEALQLLAVLERLSRASSPVPAPASLPVSPPASVPASVPASAPVRRHRRRRRPPPPPPPRPAGEQR